MAKSSVEGSDDVVHSRAKFTLTDPYDWAAMGCQEGEKQGNGQYRRFRVA